MEAPRSTHRKSVKAVRQPESFDITCVIGTITIDENAERSAHEEAFCTIAQHDTPGTYKFPSADGRTCVVAVSYE